VVLLVFALAFIGAGYAEGAGVQRGPDSFDCIGFVRWCLLHVAPQLWPTVHGGEDSYTVPNFLHWWTTLSLGAVLPPSVTPVRSDILIFGSCEHIGIADGAGNCVSAHSEARGVCSIPIGAMGLPLTYVLRTGLENAMPPVPTGVARIGTDPLIRAIATDGTLVPVALGSDVVTYGDAPSAPNHAEPAYQIADRGGTVLWLLKRNATAFAPIGATTTDAAALEAKIAAAIAALS
jgi:hypothetical protein